eukprot:TRINITY_DN4239_c0_g1_i1.p1 TRINITY_DN4239_c0_g1~~TRINITY_DN4239_c0_g1_i1.p1  ORF type:complete len:952 (+),score=330.80 TRINITY_DN4239_c0_g1_i1:67-2856(+)
MALAQQGGVNNVVAGLPSLQTSSGGFAAYEGGSPSLISTQQSLMLSSLFGLGREIDVSAAVSFVATLKNSDGGYANTAGGKSTLSATRAAVYALANAGVEVPAKAQVAEYILSVFDSDINLFADVSGGDGNLVSTAAALQSLAQLGLLADKEDLIANVQVALEDEKLSASGINFFSGSTEENAAGLVAASFTSLDLGDADAWVAFFKARQNESGGFDEDTSPDSQSRAEDAFAALSALVALGKSTGSQGLVDSIDSRGLLQFVSRLPQQLSAAAFGFGAVAQTRAFDQVLLSQFTYETDNTNFPVRGDKVTTGVSVRPSLSVSSLVPHSGLTVALQIRAGMDSEDFEMAYNPDFRTYVATESYDTSKYLGALSITARVSVVVPEIGTVAFRITDRLLSSYEINVDATVTAPNGDVVTTGGDIDVGTKFEFAVTLGDAQTPIPGLLSGPFDLILAVKDSSLVVIGQQNFDGDGNTKPITFSYTLENAALPAGNLQFNFYIGVHTSFRLDYSVGLPMVVTDLVNSKKAATLGDSVEVSFKPASATNGKATQYSSLDVNGKTGIRRFFLDVVTPAGAPVATYPGTSTSDDEDVLAYTFTIATGSSFQLIGEFELQFRYQTSDGESIAVSNYDGSKLVSEPITLSVSAALKVSEVDNKSFPKEKELKYGDTVAFTFKVSNSATGDAVSPTADSTVVLALRNTNKDGSKYTSTEVAATFDAETDQYSISFIVNPNAQKGAGVFELLGKNAGGDYVALATESEAQWAVPVEINGDITVQEEVFAGSYVDGRLANDKSALFSYFFIPFTLGAEGENLEGANLFAVVKNDYGATGIEGPVAQAQDEEGAVIGYQASFVQTIDQTPSGSYTVEFYLESDKQRGLDTVEPFFTVSFPFKARSNPIFPIRLEIVALVLLASAFLSLSFKKMELEGNRRKK